METHVKRAVVLLSGGLDSATVLAIAKSQGYELYALSFSYGQRHVIELDAARRVSAAIGVADHRIAKIDLRVFGGSALTAEIAVRSLLRRSSGWRIWRRKPGLRDGRRCGFIRR